tara:strand:- start:1711 stop:1830 length:120 start_codon:yes stop_codon:yes gene_type:complete
MVAYLAGRSMMSEYQINSLIFALIDEYMGAFEFTFVFRK